MAAKRKSSKNRNPAKRDASPGPVWPTLVRYWKPVAVVVAVVLAGWWVARMEVVYERKRGINQITSRPATALWFQQQRMLVEADGGPDALWVGEITDVSVTHPVDPTTAPRLVKVILGKALLLAGDGEAVAKNLPVYVYGHRFDGGEPEPGEHWVISSRRDGEGNQKIHAGLPFE